MCFLLEKSMRKFVLVTASLLLTAVALAANPEATTSDSPSTFRITTAEVHVSFTAVRAKNEMVTNLSPSDFKLLRDGHTIDQVTLEKYDDSPVTALVLTDVSDSMVKALPLERTASDFLRSKSNPETDRLSFLDFGEEMASTDRSRVSTHLTSLYDSLFATLLQFGRSPGERRALVLLTDGIDNYSLHGLRDVIALAQRFDIAIYAITAHPGKKQYYRPDLLQFLCEQTGGKYYEARKFDAMLAAAAAINDELRNGYEVVFRPDEAGGMHAISLESNQRGLRFYYRSAYFQPDAATEIASGE
jgi:Ca-activated chloride channel homolog